MWCLDAFGGWGGAGTTQSLWRKLCLPRLSLLLLLLKQSGSWCDQEYSLAFLFSLKPLPTFCFFSRSVGSALRINLLLPFCCCVFLCSLHRAIRCPQPQSHSSLHHIVCGQIKCVCVPQFVWMWNYSCWLWSSLVCSKHKPDAGKIGFM